MTQNLDRLSSSAVTAGDVQFQSLADLMPQIVWTANRTGQITYANKVWQAFCSSNAAATADDFIAALHADDQSAWQRAWDTVGTEFEVVARLYSVADNAWVRHLHHAVALKDSSGQIVQWFGTSVNLTPYLPDTGIDASDESDWSSSIAKLNDHLLDVLHERSHALSQLERQTQHLSEVITTQSHLAQAELELEGFMVIVVERMLKLTPATGAVVELADGDEMVYRAASGTVRPYIGLRLKMAGSLSGLCVSEGRILHCPDTATDPRVDLQACKKVDAMSMVVTPLIDRSQTIGVLKILSNQVDAFSKADFQTLQLMAGLIGAAFSHQQQFDTNQRLLAERTKALSALAQEVERRRLSEETLRASEARTRLIIDSSGEAFVATNEDGVVTDWNRQAMLTFGWQASDILGQHLAQVLLPSNQREQFAQLLAQQIGQQADTVSRTELPMLTADGRELPIELTLTFIRTGSHYLFSAFLRDISQRRSHEMRLRFLAEHDTLTGLANRRAFIAQLEAHLETPFSKDCAVLFIDLDGFKAVNDTLGHECGDLLLKEVAQNLNLCVRECDTPARFGGDEFVVLLTNLSHGEADALQVANTIIHALSAPMMLDGQQAHIGASIGIALCHADAPVDAGVLLRRADAAMYQAKRGGKNRAFVGTETH